MKPCPYRATHEWDADGLCVHCFARRIQNLCHTHRFRFTGMTVNAGAVRCVWCGRPLALAMTDAEAERAS